MFRGDDDRRHKLAIGRGLAHLLMRLAADDLFSGRLLELGRQVVYLRHSQAVGYAKRYGLAQPPVSDASLRGEFPDGAFFEMLGFDRVETCDLFETGIDHQLDLNLPIPSDLVHRFDAVFNGGTMEHVFDVPQVLKNVDDLLVQGGMVVHYGPVHNYVDHGYYTFSPMLLHDYYSRNSYEISQFLLLRHSRRWEWGSWNAYVYEPDSLQTASLGGFSRNLVEFLMIAEKGSGVRDLGMPSVPQQSIYLPGRGQDLTLRSRARASLLPYPRALARVQRIRALLRPPIALRNPLSRLRRYGRHW